MRVSPGLLFVLLVPFARGEEIVWTEASSLTLEGKAFADTVNPYDRLPRWAEGKVPDHATVDHIHPNDYGHRFMGAVYGEKIRSILGEKK